MSNLQQLREEIRKIAGRYNISPDVNTYAFADEIMSKIAEHDKTIIQEAIDIVEEHKADENMAQAIEDLVQRKRAGL